jgi:glycosyltransferase involved in cell wall biosynthesis
MLRFGEFLKIQKLIILKRLFTTKVFRRNKNPFSIPKGLKKEILKSDPSNIFHLHGGWIPVFSSLSKFLNKNQRKYVITPHGAYNTVAMEKSKLRKKVYFNLFEKRVIKNASKIHCIGESEIDGLQTVFPNQKSVLIPYGFEQLKEEFQINSDQKQIIFGFVGRLDIYTKGLDLLVESFTSFSASHPDSKFWIIGDSKEKEELQKLIESYRMSGKIELLGSKFGEEKNDLIKKMDVFVHPSRNEGLPVSVIEAAHFAKPCIVTKNTNIGYLIEKYNAGINIPFPDSKLLEQALLRFITSGKTSINMKRSVAML